MPAKIRLRSRQCAPVLATLFLAACDTVEVQQSDTTGPKATLEVMGMLDERGNPEAIVVNEVCCALRRSVPDLTPLTLVAAAEDPESGVRDIAIWIWAIKQCRYADSSGDWQITSSIVGAAGSGSGTLPPGSSAPLRLNSTASVRMADTPYGACNPKTVTDPSGQTRVVAAQVFKTCGRRVFVVAQNGNATQGASKGVSFTTGPFGSDVVHCTDMRL